MKRIHSFAYFLVSGFLFFAGCSLPYRLTHGDATSQAEAMEVYRNLSSREQAEVQTELIAIAKEANDSDVRLAAVERLTDQAMLAEIAKEDCDPDVRLAAVERLNALR
jgi:hypothetical protein